MSGETNLDKLIANMEPVLNDGDYVFASVLNTDSIPQDIIISQIKEKEGITIVLLKNDADNLQLPYSYIASWITLNIHSSLEAVGLTASFATELSNHKMSCNVIAGYYHDHIFVDKNDRHKALKVLLDMTLQRKKRIAH